MLQKEMDGTPTVKTDAAAAFLASLEDPKLTSLGETEKKPPIEILPPGMPPLSAPPIVLKKAAARPGVPTAARDPNAPIGAPMAQGAPMVQGTTVPQGTPTVQGTPMAQGSPEAQGVAMNQGAPVASESTDEAKPSEATGTNIALANAEATVASGAEESKGTPGNEEATANPGNEEVAPTLVTDAATSSDPSTATPAPAPVSICTDVRAVAPVEATIDAPSKEETELANKSSPSEGSTPPPPIVPTV
jgi:hypothetical protein